MARTKTQVKYTIRYSFCDLEGRAAAYSANSYTRNGYASYGYGHGHGHGHGN